MSINLLSITFLQVTRELLSGFGVTCLLFILTLVLALPLGLVVCFGSMSRFKPLRWLFRTIVWIIRGTPLSGVLCAGTALQGAVIIEIFGCDNSVCDKLCLLFFGNLSRWN